MKLKQRIRVVSNKTRLKEQIIIGVDFKSHAFFFTLNDYFTSNSIISERGGEEREWEGGEREFKSLCGILHLDGLSLQYLSFFHYLFYSFNQSDLPFFLLIIFLSTMCHGPQLVASVLRVFDSVVPPSAVIVVLWYYLLLLFIVICFNVL